MSKDPAFLFYPGDYIGGTMGMTFEEKGAYMDLLMLQFNRGHMTTHMIGQVVGQLWDNIKVKFVQDEQDLWYNERLDIEKAKRENFTKTRRNNLSGVNQHSNKSQSMAGHTTSRMENENINEDESNNGKESPERKTKSNCMMKNSGVTVGDIRKTFSEAPDLKNADPLHYYNQALDWSEGKGMLRKDWVAVVRNFARGDIRDGKLKVSNSATVVIDRTRTEGAPENYGVVSPSAISRKQYLEQKEPKNQTA